MEVANMGRVQVEMTVESVEDLWAARKGEITPDQVRKVVIPDALVDTGASTLALPTSVIRQLGLKKVKERPVRVATGTGTVSVYDVVQFTILGRDGKLEVIEVPDGNPTLIGQLPLEMLCFVVDPKNQRLVGDPFTGGQQILDLFPATVKFDGIIAEFTVKALPPDHPDAPKGERKGRPARSPSLPPDEPEPGEPAAS